ncbi:hypothetical protein [Chitinophaga alhagiae]|uniref:pPIWI-associating nuclease domain-containing protein n=1 Tax=Chitinophaga alhagiae TaxID=2203219 RepID=UPI000E5A743C|nr:hypothetical protein [Chitinophaga alhagiae]
MTPQEYKRKIDEYNRKAKQHNDQVRRNVDRYNRDVKRHNDQVNRNIDQYNRDVKKAYEDEKRRIQNYNSRVQQFNNTQRQNLAKAIQKFNQSGLITTHTTTYVYRTSVQNLENRYVELDNYNNSQNVENSHLLVDYPIQETNNSVQLYNSLSGTDQGDYLEPQTLQLTEVEQKLYNLSTELGKRWEGAIYSLNPKNPDAARHFCTSVREVFIQLLNIKAPDEKVLQSFPNCTMHEGRPSRREKIKYILSAQSIASQPMVAFVDADIDDILTLFRTLNDGTHGSAGTFTVQQLLKLKKRAEDSILFITALNVN